MCIYTVYTYKLFGGLIAGKHSHIRICNKTKQLNTHQYYDRFYQTQQIYSIDIYHISGLNYQREKTLFSDENKNIDKSEEH